MDNTQENVYRCPREHWEGAKYKHGELTYNPTTDTFTCPRCHGLFGGDDIRTFPYPDETNQPKENEAE